MNKHILIYVFGCFVTAINSIAVVSNIFATLRQFWVAATINRHSRNINYHFTLLVFVCLPFLSANCFAWYRFYDAWVVKRSFSSVELMMNGFTDRIFMTIVSIGLIMLIFQRIPYLIKPPPSKDCNH